MDSLFGFVLQLYRLARSTPATEFRDLALEMLKTRVPFRTATWSNAELTPGGLTFYSAHLHEEPPEMLSDFTAMNRRHTRSVEGAARSAGKSVIYHAPALYPGLEDRPMLAYMRRYQHGHILMIADESRSQWISCYRPESAEAFTDRDRALLDALLPHLIEALAINQSLTVRESPGAALQPGGRALVDSNGVLLHCGRKFVELLRLQWQDWGEPRIPAELLGSLKRNGRAHIAAAAVRITAESMGDALLLSACQSSPLERLSPRERAVAREFGAGKSYKTVAREVQLAPATVRNMLQNAYRKLGIDNKAALAKLLELDQR